MIACAQFTISDLNDASNEIIVGTQTGATASWTGVASFSELRDGQQIVYWLPYAGASNVTLNLTLSTGQTTGAIPCYYGGTTRLSTHYAAGNAIRLIYLVDTPIAGETYTGWWADANYNTNTNTYDRIRMNNSTKAKTAITAAHLVVGDASGYYHLAGGCSFDVNKPILYAASAIAVNKTGTDNYLCYPSVNLRTTTGNSSWTKTAYETCYLVGTLSGQTFTVASTDWLVTAPSDPTGTLVFISLGYMASTYQMYLYPEHPMFRMVNGVLTAISQMAYEASEAIAHLEVGGRNYILQSDVEAESKTYKIWDYDVSEPLMAGQEYTVSMCVTPAADVTAYGIWLSSGYAKQCQMTVSGVARQIVSQTFVASYYSGKTPDDNPAYAIVQVYRLPSLASGEESDTSKIHWIKVEKGNRATDWTAAPEDAEESLEMKLTAVHAQISTEADSIRQEVQATYAAASDLNSVQQQMTTLSEQTENGMTWAITQINQLQSDLTQGQQATNAQLQLIQTYMTFTNNGLIIGKAGNPFTFRVINDRLSFYMNDTEVAYLSNNKLYVTQAEILTRLQIGKFAYEPQTNGNLSIVYTG